MFLNDRNSAERIRAQRTLFSLWMAVAALVVIVTMAAGLATSASAAQVVDTMTTGSIPHAAAHHKSDGSFMMGFMIMSFILMLVASSGLTRRSLKDVKRHQSRKDR